MRSGPGRWRLRASGALLLAGWFLAAPARGGALSPDLEERIATAEPGERISAVVLMDEFPPVRTLLAEVEEMSRRERRARVIARMRELARTSQEPVRDLLADAGTEERETRVLWGINGLALEATPDLLRDIAGLDEVRWVLYDRPFRLEEVRDDGPTGGDTSGPNPDADAAGELIALGADRVWNELGYTGAGVIVAVLDTGIDPDHPDLADHLWTNLDEIAANDIDDDGNGFVDDTWGWDFCNDDNDPSDGQHGTQAAGQVAGDGTNGTITGMAPDAELMAVGIGCGVISGWWAASDYALENGADIISQSFSHKWVSSPDYEAFRRQTDTELAAGLLHANSSGNTGNDPDQPVPYNVAAPANCPPPWHHPDQRIVGALSSVLAVADVSYKDDQIASSSAHGPSAWEDIRAHTDPDYPHDTPPEYRDYPYENGAETGLLKPDVAAYGSGTTSTCPGGTYCGFNGTSAATPHVAGAVALMLSSNPEATPAELARAVLTTASHRGDPGKNTRYGAGMLDSFEAVRSVEAVLRYQAHTIDDTALDAGNGDLSADPGERLTLTVTLENVRDEATGPVEAVIRSESTDIEIHNAFATFPPVPGLATAESEAPHFSFTIAGGTCAAPVRFVIELRYDGKITRSAFVVDVGEATEVTLLDDDFEVDTGWSVDSMLATGGYWVREDPIGTTDGEGDQANPEDDASASGSVCWVTGNGDGPKHGGSGVDGNDVDEGHVFLISPPFGADDLLSLELVYHRWFYTRGTELGSDPFLVTVSNDGGETWADADNTVDHEGVWTERRVDLLAAVEPSTDMLLRFTVSDGGFDTTVEGAVDEVRVEGVRVLCEDHAPEARKRPNDVGATLLLRATPSGHVRLDWDEAPADGDHDPATLYRVLASDSPAGTMDGIGSATATEWTDVDAAGTGEDRYYLVVAENSGGRSDEAP